MNDLYIMHYGVGHDKGGHSGRYPWGSGENPRQDLQSLKRIGRENTRNASRLSNQIMGKHPNWWREDVKAISKESGVRTTWGWGSIKNRPAIEAAIRRRYKTNPNFRKRVHDARQEWINIGKKAQRDTESYINHYSSGPYVPSHDIRKAQSWVDRFSDQTLHKAGADDVDFATKIMFDDQLGFNRAKTAGKVVLTIGALWAINTYLKSAMFDFAGEMAENGLDF